MNRRDMLKYAGTGAAVSLLGVTTTPEAQAQGGTLNAVWVHGTAVEAEDLGALNGIQRVGWGTLFRGKPKVFTWFHISIPTPVIINDVRPRLERIFVFYKTNGASIRNVHVYDGPRIIKAFDDLRLEGDRSGNIAPANTWAFDRPITLGFSLGLSLGVQFAVGFDSVVTTEILFTTAGADFRLKSAGPIRQEVIRDPIGKNIPGLKKP